MLRKILYDLHYNNLVSSNLLSDWCGREQVHGHQHVILLAACQLHLLQSCLGSGIWWTPPNFASPNCKKFQSVAYLPTWFILFIYLFNSIYNFYLFLLEFICFFLFFFFQRVLLFDTYLSPTSTDRAKDTWDLTWGYVMSFREVISYTKENKGKTGPYAAAAQNGERSKRKDKQSKVSGCLMMVGLCASAKDTVPHLLLFPLERQPHLCREKRDTYLMVVIGAPKSVCSLSPICSFYIQPFHCHFPH